MTELTRRAFVLTGGTSVLASGAVALTACAPNPPRPGSQGGPRPPEALDDSALASGTLLASLTDIPVGATHAVTVDGHEILLSRPSDDKAVAFSAICTHQGCIVAAADDEFDCPCHGSRFASATGAVLGGPAQRPLRSIAVTISGSDIVIA